MGIGCHLQSTHRDKDTVVSRAGRVGIEMVLVLILVDYRATVNKHTLGA